LHKLTGYEGSLFPILATLAAAVLFTPAKNRIRVLVNKTFYRVRYDYRKAIQEFTRQVDSAFTQNELLNLLLKKVDTLLMVTRSLILLEAKSPREFEIAGSASFSIEELEEIEREKNNLSVDLYETREIQGVVGSTAFEEFPVLPEDRILKKFEIQLSFPMIQKGESIGLLLLGKKKSETRYSAEDVELVSIMVQEVARALQNITMRQRIVAEQVEKEKLQELNQLKTKFISNVSHDLRTPLTAIRFSADNMQKGVYGDISEDNRKHLQMIRDNALHVSRTIDNLLTLCMSESGKLVLNKERLPLSMVVDEACGMLKALAEKKGIELVRENMQDIFVNADKHSLLEILLNLLDNAIKYTDKKGKVSVSARPSEDKGFTEISVTDDGMGIAPEDLERIFERFQKAEPVGITGEKGAGIGLDIVRNLVGLHGGEVRVESPVPETGKGARFTFTLERD
jgi:signal transduction histidine kinase